MITANVYSVGELAPETKQSIHDGFDLVGQYLGDISVKNIARVTVPVNSAGIVELSRVGYANFDSAIDLHLFAGPLLTGHGDTSGIAVKGKGVAWLSTRERYHADDTRGLVAHEVAHAFGYVLDDSPQAMRFGGSHCGAPTCIMYPEFTEKPVGIIRKLLTPLYKTPYAPELSDDFCTPCQADMRDTFDEHLEKMKATRASTGVVLTREDLKNMPQPGAGKL